MSFDPKAVIVGVKGRIEGTSNDGIIINNLAGNIDNAYFVYANSLLSKAAIRVEHSTLPNFWIEIPLDLKQLKYLLDEDEKRLKEERLDNEKILEEEKDFPTSIPVLKYTCTRYNCRCNSKVCETYN
jgi:hypothetical protein